MYKFLTIFFTIAFSISITAADLTNDKSFSSEPVIKINLLSKVDHSKKIAPVIKKIISINPETKFIIAVSVGKDNLDKQYAFKELEKIKSIIVNSGGSSDNININFSSSKDFGASIYIYIDA